MSLPLSPAGRRYGYLRKPEPLRPRPSVTEHICSQCKITKPASDFYRDARYRTGLDSRCKNCVRAHLQKWQAENHERFREVKRRCYWRQKQKWLEQGRKRRKEDATRIADRDLRKKYGIGLAEKQALLASQGGRCAVCGADTPGGPTAKWHLDHDHSTNKVRSVLCNGCNLALGAAKDNPELLEKLAGYLREHHDASSSL